MGLIGLVNPIWEGGAPRIMRKDVEKVARRNAKSSLLIILLGLSPFLLSADPKFQYGSASLVNLLPVARAQDEALPDRLESAARLKKLGQRRAIVFSPDFAASGNQQFYEGLRSEERRVGKECRTWATACEIK